MCGPDRAAGTFAAGLEQARTGRRALLSAGAGGLLLSSLPGAASASARRRPRHRKRAYVLVVDGCRPDEIDALLTPNLHALRERGLHLPRAASLPVMETIPNHVMMMTGVRPDRSGVPANAIHDRELGKVRTMDRPTDIAAPTVIGRLNRHGLTTGTVLSKEYLYGVFGTRATHRWEPAPVVPVSGHAPDRFTMDAALAMVDELDPDFMFVILGDVDRFGHADLTGTTLRLQRRVALADTDRQVGRFVDMLRATGRWRHSMLLVLADHSMDWSTPEKVVSLQAPMDADPLLAGRVRIADNGGADLLYWTGPARDRDRAVDRMRAIAHDHEGVLAAHDRREPSLRLGPEAGDVVAYCHAGWRFSDPDPVTDNPIPGNHGHPATRPIPFFVTGGHPRVPRGVTDRARAHTIDVAPTVASFLGVGAPRGGWDGHTRL
ncbi:alkaline phosphatase family protein [Nocardioides sp. MAHUQ-72]|uniref:alkaline phosphatase family protein n=1 Tax=unclassified Nocardioides TaxID=2615069 RepID=UPI00360DF146